MDQTLPILDVMPALLEALERRGVAVLQAPPGAGKTTGVPLAMLRADLVEGRILMLEPRRLAARAAAERMAEMLGEEVGARVGYRMRGANKVGPAGRIEVVTEGILTRMLQSDPELPGIGAVIFDEFHERSLNADLGLALVWEVCRALRPDLKVLVMSATLDAGPVAQMLDDAPVITSHGRSFEVETRWLDRPSPGGMRLEDAATPLVRQAMAEPAGGVLVFLPGAGEIERVARGLEAGGLGDFRLHRLYGAVAGGAQRAAIRPEPDGRRKLVLASAIAETSLTIPDIRVVVDAGRARRARYDPGSGMARLVTEPVSRAEADQRRGRAGRVGPGIAYRMWARAEEGALPAFAPPEIETADLTGLALELAMWGGAVGGLAFLNEPPAAGLDRARALLRRLGALDGGGAMTAHGRAMAALPLHPRLAHMLLRAGPDAAAVAALLSDRDPMRGSTPDLAARVAAIAGGRGAAAADPAALARIRAEAKRLARMVGPVRRGVTDPGEQAALAFPDRVGLRRKGDAGRFVLSGGKGVLVDGQDALAGRRLIVAVETDGKRPEARVRLAAELSEPGLRDLFEGQIGWQETVAWSRREDRVLAERQERFGALVLRREIWRDAPADAVAAALTEGLEARGIEALKLNPATEFFRMRVAFLRAGGADMPDMSDAGLLGSAADWFTPFVGDARHLGALAGQDWQARLRGLLSWEQGQELDRLAPPSFVTPLGRKIAISYGGEAPAIALRLQEMFGQASHPVVGPARTPLVVTLLSPAGRPLQVTADLPGFWASSYGDVRRDMRGRYPKHPWPEDPAAAAPTLRAKPRK